jgi:Ca2+-binding RTX toxin-like protein
VTAALSGLAPRTRYYFRVVAVNSVGRSYGAGGTVVATGVTLQTDAAQVRSATSATFAGEIDARDPGVAWYFEYGRTTAYGSRASVGTTATGGRTSVTATVRDLSGGVLYHYRLVAVVDDNRVYGDDHTLATPQLPSVRTGKARAVSARFATLTGAVAPNGVETRWYFDYGPTTAYGSRSARVPVGGNREYGAAVVVRRLRPGALYHFRLVAISQAGRSTGTDHAFATPTLPSRACTLVGTTGADVLTGTAGAEVICGLSGADVIRGMSGDDVILGGAGNDRISGGAGRDRILGGGGDDTIDGSGGRDAVDGQGGDDRILGSGTDVLDGGEGNDAIVVGSGGGVANGGPGVDTVYLRGRNERVRSARIVRTR